MRHRRIAGVVAGAVLTALSASSASAIPVSELTPLFDLSAPRVAGDESEVVTPGQHWFVHSAAFAGRHGTSAAGSFLYLYQAHSAISQPNIGLAYTRAPFFEALVATILLDDTPGAGGFSPGTRFPNPLTTERLSFLDVNGEHPTLALVAWWNGDPLFSEGYSIVFGGIVKRTPATYDVNVGDLTGTLIAPATPCRESEEGGDDCGELERPVPEPSTLTLLGAGLAGLAATVWWRKYCPAAVGPFRVIERIASDQAARLWHPWLRIQRLIRVILGTRWGADEWPIVSGNCQARHATTALG